MTIDEQISYLGKGTVELIRDADGRVTGSINVFQDITQRKAVEERLRSRETELQLIRASAPVSSAWAAIVEKPRHERKRFTVGY